MGDKLTSRKVLLAATQAVAGVAEVLDPATDGILALSGAAVTPSGEVVGDDRLSSSLSKVQHRVGKESMALTYPCELRGGGITGSAVAVPEFNPLLLACAMAKSAVVFLETGAATGTFEAGEALSGGTSSATGTLIEFVDKNGVRGLLIEAVTGTFEDAEVVTGGDSAATATASADPLTAWQYLPQSDPDAMAIATCGFNESDHDFVSHDARGTFSFDGQVGQVGKINFEMSGRYNNPTESARVAPTLNTALPPLVVGAGLKLGTFSPAGVNAIALAIGNSVVKDEDLNASDGLAGFVITSREPSGSIDPKADSLSTFNPYTDWKAGTLAVLDMLIGTAAGNRVYIRCPAVQYTDAPARGEREKRVTYGLNFQPKGAAAAGDDEIRLVFF